MEDKKPNNQPLGNEATPELNDETLDNVTGGFDMPVRERGDDGDDERVPRRQTTERPRRVDRFGRIDHAEG